MGKDAYAEACLRDPVILALADRVEFVPDDSLPGPQQFKGVVRIELSDGRAFEEVEEHNRGSRENPMTAEEIIGKFRENVAGVVSDDRAKDMVEKVLSLDDEADASALTRLAAHAHG
jgi:2-methylcitrate dehydratase PrpD